MKKRISLQIKAIRFWLLDRLFGGIYRRGFSHGADWAIHKVKEGGLTSFQINGKPGYFTYYEYLENLKKHVDIGGNNAQD